jgi:tRNA (guanine-N7-)-methyltransferase
MSILSPNPFRLRSFVRRGRRTNAQERAYREFWPRYGLQAEAGFINYQHVFGREARRFLEIGFGSGQSLLALAKAEPDNDFIGVETHQPGIGALFLGIQINNLTNLRIYDGDAIDVFQRGIPAASLDGIQLFFPDPWPKRRHHARRLIQPDFIKLVVEKLKTDGILHLATDWHDYAKHMLYVLSQESHLTNLAGLGHFAGRSPKRPVLTKFERRAEREGRHVWELQFIKP